MHETVEPWSDSPFERPLTPDPRTRRRDGRGTHVEPDVGRVVGAHQAEVPTARVVEPEARTPLVTWTLVGAGPVRCGSEGEWVPCAIGSGEPYVQRAGAGHPPDDLDLVAGARRDMLAQEQAEECAAPGRSPNLVGPRRELRRCSAGSADTRPRRCTLARRRRRSDSWRRTHERDHRDGQERSASPGHRYMVADRRCRVGSSTGMVFRGTVLAGAAPLGRRRARPGPRVRRTVAPYDLRRSRI